MKKIHSRAVYQGECKCSGSHCKEETHVRLSHNDEMGRGVLTVYNSEKHTYETVFLTAAQMTFLAESLKAVARLIQHNEVAQERAGASIGQAVAG